MKGKTSWYLIMIVVFLIWGTNYPALKIISAQVPPFLFVFLKYLIAVLIIGPLALKNRAKIEQQDWLPIIGLAFIGMVFTGAVNIVAIGLSTATHNAIIVNSAPLFVILLAPILLGEKVSRAALGGTALGFLGIIAVITNGQDLGSLLASSYFIGDILMLAVALAIAINAMYSERFINKYGGIQLLFHVILAALVMSFIGSLATGEFSAIPTFTTETFLLLAWIAIVTGAIGRVVWYDSIKKIGLVETSAFFLIIPVSGIVWSHIFLNDPLTIFTIIGAACVILGVYIVQTRNKPKQIHPEH